MTSHRNIDATLRALNWKGRYQMLQMVIHKIGNFGTAYQLLCNIFVGRYVKWHQCSAPDNTSLIPTQLQDVDWNSSHVQYGQCEITVSQHDHSNDSRQYSCLFGYDYDFSRDKSFRTEFDLVCDWKLLGGMAQSFVIMGQGVGAFLSSVASDRFGRKKILVLSQVGLLVFGLASGFAPSYTFLALFKFIIGGMQQGVMTSLATISIELLPAEYRSVEGLIGSIAWGACVSSMAFLGFLFRDHDWRTLQIVLSCFSAPVVLLQWWFCDESIRWLLVNGRREEAVRVLEKAARANGKDIRNVLRTLDSSSIVDTRELLDNEKKASDESKEPSSLVVHSDQQSELMEDEKEAERLTLCDLFRTKRLFLNLVIMWFSWFTCAFSFFALYMMSTTLHGDRFLNYFLTSLMELIPGFILYFMLDRMGRKWATSLFYILSGVGLVTSGAFRIFSDNATLRVLSVVSAMVGMIGSSGIFRAVFFYTPELFPTNVRNQALGMCSTMGRLGGMLAPFMTALADMAVWAPGAMIGSLCFLVVCALYILPETKGRELPNTIQDVQRWTQEDQKRKKEKEATNE